VIRASHTEIGKNSQISEMADIFCPGGFSVGDNCVIQAGAEIRCWKFEAGDYLFMKKAVTVGGGGSLSSPTSSAQLGSHVFIGERSILNTACALSIGDQVGIGADVGIWTHGAYLNHLQGFPVRFAPVWIGSSVWIQGASQVLPGVSIMNCSIILMGSIVTKDVIRGAMVGGVPAKVLETPFIFTGLELERLDDILDHYQSSVEWRGIPVTVERIRPDTIILRKKVSRSLFDVARFDCSLMQIKGAIESDADLIDDLADHLRRYGIRFNTGRPYRSIPHPAVAKLEEA
jgi:acetyltransferase-like isoleucine patch superfamily enzyme